MKLKFKLTSAAKDAVGFRDFLGELLKEYIKAFEIIIESYEMTEQQLVEGFGPLRRFGSNIQVDVLDNSFLTDLLSGVYIE